MRTRKSLLLAALAAGLSAFASAETPRDWGAVEGVVAHAGALTTNETWAAGAVHVVHGPVQVPAGVTLTVGPDAVVKFCTGQGLRVDEGGACVFENQAGRNRPVFTHIHDDLVGGDVDGDGGAHEPPVGAYTLQGVSTDTFEANFRCLTWRPAGEVIEQWNPGLGGGYVLLYTVKAAEDGGRYLEFTGSQTNRLEDCTVSVAGRIEQNGTFYHVQSFAAGAGTTFRRVSLRLPSEIFKYAPSSSFVGSNGSIVSLEVFRSGDSLYTIPYNCFSGSRVLETLSLAGIRCLGGGGSTGWGAFMQSEKLKTVYLDEGLEEIGEYAFQSCTALERVTLPSTLRTIGKSGFSACKGLASVDLGQVASLGESAFQGSGLVEVVLPDTVTNVAQKAFNCDACRTVTIGRGLKHVQAGWMPQSVERLVVNGAGDTVIGENCVNYHTFGKLALREVELHGVVAITNASNSRVGAFQGCDNLRRVSFDDCLREVGAYAFNKSGLESIALPGSVTNVAESAFAGCSRLVRVELGANLRHIGASAFEQCPALYYLEIPASVESLGALALGGGGSAFTALFDGPPPAGIGDLRFSSTSANPAKILRPQAHAAAWEGVAVRYAAVLPDPAETWTRDASRDWANLPGVQAHAGVVEADEIWPADRVHVVHDGVTVPRGVTVTVEPGAVVKFCPGAGLLVHAGGRFVVRGATLTHVRDDQVGGDTDGDYGARAPVGGEYRIYGFLDEDASTVSRYRLFHRQGTLEASEDWTGAGNVYLLDRDFSVPAGVSLKIGAGTVVKLRGGVSLTVRGTLDAAGTSLDPVTFTSWRDASAGGGVDAVDGSPVWGDWKRVEIIGGNARANFVHTVFRYGCSQISNSVASDEALLVVSSDAEASVRDSVFEEGFLHGILNRGGRATAENCVFRNLKQAAVRGSGSGRSRLLNCVVTRCGYAVAYSWPPEEKILLRNCILHLPVTGWGWSGSSYDEALGRVNFDHCCFWAPEGEGRPVCPWAGANGNILADPAFVDAPQGDYRIAALSPCVDAAAYEVPARDHYGRTRQNVRPDPTGEPCANGRYADIGLHEVMPARIAGDAADLWAGSVSAPHALEIGQDVEVSWGVRNFGEVDATAPRRDRVDLVTEDGRVHELGTVVSQVAVRRGGAFMETCRGRFRVPAVSADAASVRVVVNSEHDVFEGGRTANNVAASASVPVSVPVVALDPSGTSLVLPAKGSTCLRLPDGVAPGTLLVVRVAGGKAPTELVVRAGAQGVPTAQNAVAEATAVGDGAYLLSLPGGAPGLALENPTDDVLEVVLAPGGTGLVLYDAGLQAAVNTNVTRASQISAAEQWTADCRTAVRFWGGGFAEGLSASLVKDGVRVASTNVLVFGANSGCATFDVFGLEPGVWTLEVGQDAARASVPRVQLYDPAHAPDLALNFLGLVCDVDNPNPIRSGRGYTVTALWRSTSLSELDAPYLRLKAGRGSAIREIGASAWTDEIDFIGVSSTYPADRVKPGEYCSADFEFVSTVEADYAALPGAITAGGRKGGGGGSKSRDAWSRRAERQAMNQRYKLVAAKLQCMRESDQAYPWKNNEQYNRPPDLPDEAWNAVSAGMRALYGTSWTTWTARLRERARALARLAKEPLEYVSVNRIFQADVSRFLRPDPVMPELSSGTDLSRGGRGVPLALGRAYSTAPGLRFSTGLFGLGWHSPLEVRLTFEGDSVAYVGVPGGEKTVYTRVARDAPWTNADHPGADRLEDGRQVFRDGTTRTFDAKGRLVALQDARGRGVTLAYDAAGRLAQARHTDGGTLAFAYAGDGACVASVTDDLGRAVTYGYATAADGRPLLVSSRDVAGNETAYSYRAADATPASLALARTEPPGGPARAFAWDDLGRLDSLTVGDTFVTEFLREGEDVCRVVGPDGGVRTYTFGVLGELRTVTGADGAEYEVEYVAETTVPSAIVLPGGRRFALEYSAAGDVTSLTDAAGGVSSVARNARGKVESLTDPAGGVRTHAYTEAGDLAKEVSPSGILRDYAYDADGNCVRMRFGADDATGISLDYDGRGRVTGYAAADGSRRVGLAYDALDRVTNVSDSVAGDVSFAYDALGRLTRFTSGDADYALAYDGLRGLSELRNVRANRGERTVYDAFGRVESVQDADAPGTVYLRNVYDPASGQLVREVYGNGVETAYERDAGGRPVRILTTKDGKVLADYRYSYGPDGNLASARDATGDHAYLYDPNGQLVRAVYGDGAEQAFAYDAAGTRRNAACTETRDETTGNLVGLGDGNGTARLAYDAFNRLCAVTNADAHVRWSCTYDAFGARCAVTSGGVVTRRVTLPGTNRLLDEYEDGTCVRHHVWANGRRVAVVLKDGTVRYLHADLQGSVRLVTNGSGAATATASFRAFGETASRSGADAALCGWVAAYGVETDPVGLHWMFHRYYSSALGRFISEDPLGILAGDFNFARYCGNNPLMLVDPYGLFGCSFWKGLKMFADTAGLVAAGVGLFVSGPVGVTILLGVSITTATISTIAGARSEGRRVDGLDLALLGVSIASSALPFGLLGRELASRPQNMMIVYNLAALGAATYTATTTGTENYVAPWARSHRRGL